MSVVKVLARGWVLEVESAVPATYVEVKGITSLTFDKSKTDADTTTFDEDGVETHIVASRTSSISFDGFFLEDPANGDRDPGQERVETVSELMGASSVSSYKLTSPGGTIRTFSASSNVSGLGGGNNDPSKWSGELKVSGAITVT